MTETLESAKTRARTARTALAVAADRLARARGMKTSASAEVVRQTEIDDGWIERQQRRNEAHLAGGSSGPPPALVADAKAQLAKASADANLRAWVATVENLELVHAQCFAEASTAERELRAAADAVLVGRGDHIAAEIERSERQLLDLGMKLRALGDVVPLSARAQAALGNELHMTLSDIQARFDKLNPGRSSLAIQGVEEWRTERAALMQVDPAATATPSEERAA